MTRRRLSLLALVALATQAPAALAERDPAQLLYLCRPAQSYLRLMEVSAASAEDARQAAAGGDSTEVIQTSDLIKLAPENAQGYRLRLGSRVLTKTCGAFTVAITGGFLNSDPGGAEGVSTFPVVTITHHQAAGKARGKATRFAPLTIGRCDASFARFSYTTACPTHWATEVVASGDGAEDKPTLSLTHSYQELRDPEPTR